MTLTLVTDRPTARPLTGSRPSWKVAEADALLEQIRLYETVYGRGHRVDLTQPCSVPSNVAVLVRRYNQLADELHLTDDTSTVTDPDDAA